MQVVVSRLSGTLVALYVESSVCLPDFSTVSSVAAAGMREIQDLEMTFETLSDEELWAIANPIMDNLMEGSTEINHAKHCRDFTQRMLNIVTPEYLEKVCKSYQEEKGFFTTRLPVALFRRPGSIAFVWIQHFSKAKGDHVAEMVLVSEDDRFLVGHALVF